VKGGEEVKILENESGEDLTAVTFAQIILEEERKKNGLLSLRVMRELIQHGESALQGIAATVDRGMDVIRPAAEAARTRMQEGVQGLTSIGDRLTEIQRNFDEVVRRQVEKVTSSPARGQHRLRSRDRVSHAGRINAGAAGAADPVSTVSDRIASFAVIGSSFSVLLHYWCLRVDYCHPQ